MSDHSKRSALFLDNGLFVSFAATLAQSFGEVFYWSPWISAYPRSTPMLIGVGVPGLKRVDNFWPLIDEVDIIIFPDVYYGDLQEHLVSLGHRVWGGRMGEELELDREKSKEILDSVGVDIGPYRVITGMDALRAYLKKHENVWVKISRSRGDTETFNSKHYAMVEPKLDELEYKLGPMKRTKEFIVEDAIDDAVEIGFDGWVIDGKFTKKSMWGIEIKDSGFVLQSTTYDKIPAPAQRVNALMSDLFKEYQYRGFFSSEIRVTKDGGEFMVDPCSRLGSPCNELQQIMVTNWADIIWEGAAGNLVEPVFAAKWGAELMLKSEWALVNWQAIAFPKSIAENVKIHRLAVMDGKHYCVPHFEGTSTIGAVVALGDTMEEAIGQCREVAEKVEGYYVTCDADSLDEAQGEMDKIAKLTKTEKEAA